MSEFHFLRPWWFFALLPVALILVALWRKRTSGSVWQAVLEPPLLQRLWLEPPGRISRLPLWLLGLGWLLSILALAGPVWERQPEPVWQAKAARILILDLSSSMDAADLAPSRLERARFKILDVLAKSREGRNGLVVFAGEAHIVTPLTDDGDTIVNLLSALSTGIIPAAGDTGAPALQLAADLLDQAGVSHGDLLLFTDGLADPAATLGMARDLRQRGHRLSVLGVGTVQGAPVPRADGGFGGMARLPVDTLQELARSGGGSFSQVTAGDRDLARLLRGPQFSAQVRQLEDTGVERWIERGVWILPLVLLLAATGFRRDWLAATLLILILPPPLHAFEWRDLWLRADQQAANALEQGQAEEAATRFSDPAWRGMALFEAGDYAAAAAAFAESTNVDADYNRGNSLAWAGQLAEAADVYRQVLEQATGHADAEANLALVEKLLQQAQQQANQEQSADDSAAQQNPQQQQQADGSSDQQEQQGQEGEQQQAQEAGDTANAEGGEKDRTAGEQAQAQPDAAEDQDAAKDQEPEVSASDTARTGSQQLQPQPSEREQEDSMAAARRDVADQAQTEGGGPEAADLQDIQRGVEGDPSPVEKPLDESELALKQWLRQIPEDPAGLMRRKFMVEHLRRMERAE